MKQAIVALFFIFYISSIAWAQETVMDQDKIHFKTADIFIDSKEEALSAYQVEIGYNKDWVKIVGLEGGEVDAFKEPPFFDPEGMKGGRIIIAAFTADDENTPKGETRVARLHLQIEGEQSIRMTIKLMTAAKPGGERIRAVPVISVNNKQR